MVDLHTAPQLSDRHELEALSAFGNSPYCSPCVSISTLRRPIVTLLRIIRMKVQHRTLDGGAGHRPAAAVVNVNSH
jgi:hypothetical protein